MRLIDADEAALRVPAMRKFLDAQPTAVMHIDDDHNVIFQHHAHWREIHLIENVLHVPVVYTCSNCKESALTDGFKYCPYCGAKMDEEAVTNDRSETD